MHELPRFPRSGKCPFDLTSQSMSRRVQSAGVKIMEEPHGEVRRGAAIFTLFLGAPATEEETAQTSTKQQKRSRLRDRRGSASRIGHAFQAEIGRLTWL